MSRLVSICPSLTRNHTPKPSRALLGLGLHLFFAGFSTALAQSAAPPWSSAIGAGGNGFTLARAVKAAPDGSYYVTGQFGAWAHFSGTWLMASGEADIFLAKYSASNQLLWIVTAGGSGNDEGWGLDLDAGGNVYVTGWFTNTATFNSVNGSSTTSNEYGPTIFLARYSPDGNLAWIQTGSLDYGIWDNFGYGIAVDQASNTVYLACLGQNTTFFSSADGSVTPIWGTDSWHMVIAQYDTDGNFKWAQTNNPSGNSVPYGIAVDSAGNAYVTGWFENFASFSSSDGTYLHLKGISPAESNNDFPDDIFLVKYDRNGKALWVNDIGGYKAIGNAVAVSPGGEVTLVGFIGNVEGTGVSRTIVGSRPPRGSYTLKDLYLTNPYNADALIVTYSGDGVLKRALRIGKGGSEDAKGVTYDAGGNLYVVGIAQQSAVVRANLFLRKYSGGTLLWEQKAESSALWISEGTAPAVSVSNNGIIFVAGGYQQWARFGPSTLPWFTFDPSAGDGHGAADMFVAQMPVQ